MITLCRVTACYNQRNGMECWEVTSHDGTRTAGYDNRTEAEEAEKLTQLELKAKHPARFFRTC
jgi:hypothetical protein